MRQIKIICLAVVLFAAACAKSNYLTVGETATVQDEDGMYLRTAPSTSAPKVVVVSKGKQVYVIAEGKPEKLFEIKSKWYRVRYGQYEGWMWGGLARPARRSSESGGMRIQPGEYEAEGDHGNPQLIINCDGTFESYSAFNHISGIVIGSKLRVTATQITKCFSDPDCDENKIDRRVEDIDAAEYMQGFKLQKRTNCR